MALKWLFMCWCVATHSFIRCVAALQKYEMIKTEGYAMEDNFTRVSLELERALHQLKLSFKELEQQQETIDGLQRQRDIQLKQSTEDAETVSNNNHFSLIDSSYLVVGLLVLPVLGI